MSIVPPGPRFRLRGEAPSSRRWRIVAISAALAGSQGRTNCASRTARIALARAASEPYTGRALHNACRSHNCPRPLAKYLANSASDTANMPFLPVGRKRGSSSYNRPNGPMWVTVLMIRWLNWLKKCWLVVLASRRPRTRDTVEPSAS